MTGYKVINCSFKHQILSLFHNCDCGFWMCTEPWLDELVLCLHYKTTNQAPPPTASFPHVNSTTTSRCWGRTKDNRYSKAPSWALKSTVDFQLCVVWSWMFTCSCVYTQNRMHVYMNKPQMEPQPNHHPQTRQKITEAGGLGSGLVRARIWRFGLKPMMVFSVNTREKKCWYLTDEPIFLLMNKSHVQTTSASN